MESSFLFLNFLGTGEFVLIAFVFLLLFGPDKIPGLARNLGKGIRKIKHASNDIKHEIHESSKGLDSVGSEIKNDIEELHPIIQCNNLRNINKTSHTKLKVRQATKKVVVGS